MQGVYQKERKVRKQMFYHWGLLLETIARKSF